MTGAEIAGVGKVVTEAGKAALSEDAGTKAQLARIAENSPEMQAAAKAYAKRVEIRQTIVLRLMQPLGRLAGFSSDYFENQFSDELAEKLTEVPEEAIQPPKPNVAVPAMQALGYSLDEPELKEMYLNLLARASDSRSSAVAHPGIAEVIKQLSGNEARLLAQILAARLTPAIRIKTAISGSSGFQIAHSCIIQLTNLGTGQQATNLDLPGWLDNWSRLGLIEKDFSNHFTDTARYAWRDENPLVLQLREKGLSVQFDNGIVKTTDFGVMFEKAVATDKVAEQASELARMVRQARKAAQSSSNDGETENPPAEPEP